MTAQLDQALAIARIELLRHARQQREQPWRVFFELFLVTFVALVVVGGLPELPSYPAPGAYHYGRVSTGSTAGSLTETRGFVGIVFVLLTLVTMLWTMKGQDWREQPDCLLTTVPLSVLVAGDLFSKVGKALRFLSLGLVGGAVAFAIGSNSVLAGLGVLVGGLALVCLAVTCGYTAGLAGLVLLRRSKFVRNHRLLVGSPLIALYFGLFVGSRQAGALLGGLPIGWYADVPVAAATGRSVGTALVVLVATVPLVVGLWRVSVGLAGHAWLEDPPQADAPTADAGSVSAGRGSHPGAGKNDVRGGASKSARDTLRSSLDDLLAVAVSRPTRLVIYTVWRRSIRVPQALLYVLLPLVLLLFVGIEIGAAAPAAIPVIVAVYAAGAVGAGATLNPLGNEGRMLPVTKTTPDGPQTVIRGYVLSAVLAGLLPAVALTALTTGAISSSAAVLLLSVFTGLLTVAFACVSVGVGVRLPEFDGLRPSGSTGLTTPHVYAVLVYSLICALVTAPLFGAILLTQGCSTGGPFTRAVLVGGLSTVALALLAGFIGYRSAVRAFEAYQPEESSANAR